MNKHPNQKTLFLAIFAILLIAVFWQFSGILSFPQSEIALEKGEEVKIENGESLVQNFFAKQNGLVNVQLLLRTPGVKEEDTMKMQILDENCENPIREGKLKETYLASDNLYAFEFERIPDSADKNYCLKLTFEAQKENRKAVRFFTTDDKHFPHSAENISTGEKMEGWALSIRPSYENDNIFQDIRELNQRVSQYKPWFLKHHYLYFIVFGFLILSIFLVIALILI